MILVAFHPCYFRVICQAFHMPCWTVNSLEEKCWGMTWGGPVIPRLQGTVRPTLHLLWATFGEQETLGIFLSVSSIFPPVKWGQDSVAYSLDHWELKWTHPEGQRVPFPGLSTLDFSDKSNLAVYGCGHAYLDTCVNLNLFWKLEWYSWVCSTYIC